jgi:alpha,alpha-trehalose phosphorylase
VIKQPEFSLDPWSLRETGLNLDRLAQTESVFALSNGHIGWRGVLDEGEPNGLPGSYLNGVFEDRPLPFAERSYGRPESGQTIINVTNGKLIRLFVDDEPFDVRYGSLRSHERVLDFRTGLLSREAEWASPASGSVRVMSQRLVSFSHRAVAAIRYEVAALGQPAQVTVQSELVANEQLPAASDDPRAAAALDSPLTAEYQYNDANLVLLVHRTKHSGLRVGAIMDHLIEGPDGLRTDAHVSDDVGMVTATAMLEPGQRLRLVKFVAYGWSSTRSLEAVRDQVSAALSSARHAGWEGLAESQRDYLADFWDRSDVEVDGDPEIQQAVRFSLFHVLQAGARGEDRPIPAKGLTGPGYDGHTFWDTEMFVLPLLSLTAPDAAASALRWRHSTLPTARARAAELGFAGAAFAWRTITGPECSGYWPASLAAFHVNAAIADAVLRYVAVTGDTDFDQNTGTDLLVQTARLWRSLGHHDSEGRFHIDGVTGPDEYSALADDNVYTNLMAQQNLLAAAERAERYPDRARELGVDMEEAASWRDAATKMFIPYDDALGVHPQSAGFTGHQAWDFAGTPADHYPLMLHYPYFDLYRKQVVKQADLVLALQRCSQAFTAEQKARNFDYYETLTVRDSSLSANTQAVMAAEVGELDLAFDYLGEAALIDLDDLEHNTRDGVHIASLAGTYVALISGFAGLRYETGAPQFAPRLPDGMARLAFTIVLQGRRLRVEIKHKSARYLLVEGEPLGISHHGDAVTLTAGKPSVHAIPAITPRARARQPAGREPARRRPARADGTGAGAAPPTAG